MTHPKKAVAVLLVLAASIALAACGSSGSDSEETINGQFELVPDAPSGYSELAGEAELTRSEGGTQASIQLSGLKPDTAYVAHVHAAGCDQPDPGGPHFKFDKNGSDEPPNEIHFSFTSSAEGEGEAQAENEREVPTGEAGSIVLHLGEAEGDEAMSHEEGDEAMSHGSMEHGGHSHADKIACAELEGGEEASTTAEGSGGEGSGKGGTTIVVKNGEPVGGVQRLEYSAGEQIEFTVDSDVADEIHVHGYDLMKDVPAGGSVSFSFPAEIEGIFEAELEGRKEQIAEIRVNP
jgi:hypothetical protein